MSHITRFAPPGGVLLAVCAAFAGCSSRTDVSVTGSTPSQYQHVYVTTQEVWFNTSATATPEDSSWVKFPLTTPVTVDLVTQSNGSLGQLVSGLQLTPGSYAQMRLIPVDGSSALTPSAQALGAIYNEEADYVDSAGTTHQLVLELPNPDKGFGIQGSLSVPVGNVGATAGALGGTGTTLGSTNDTTNNGTINNGTTDNSANPFFGLGSSTTDNTTATSTSTTSTTTTVSFAMNFDGARDLTTFTYGLPSAPQSGVLLSAHPTAYDLASAGAISGTLTLTSLTAITNLSDRVNIQATAEVLSADGTRHIAIASAPVQTDGTFVLYPLPSNSSTPTVYDVVIHGPGIATMIIKQIPVTVTPPTTSTPDTTVATVATTTATTPVSLGTFIPRAVTPFLANIASVAGSPLPGGAAVGFYQSLPSGEAPYLIEEVAIDPFNLNLATSESLSPTTVDTGTYTTSGTTITLTSSTPTEGAGTYRVAAVAPLFADGALTADTTVRVPTAGGTSTVAVPALTVASGATAASITAVITPSTPGKYDEGEIIVTHDGAVIGTATLDSTLAAGGTVAINGLPGSFGSALYYLSVRVWNSSNAASTLTRQWYSSPVDLRGGSVTGVALTVN